MWAGEASTSGGPLSSRYDQEDKDPLPQLPILMGNHFDIETYAEHYTGRSKIRHLLSIADQSKEEEQELEALRMAYEEAKKGKDVNLFKKTAEKINGRLGPHYALDRDWCDEVNRNWAETKQRVVELAKKREAEFVSDVDASPVEVRRAFVEVANLHYIHGETRVARIWYKEALLLFEMGHDYWDLFLRAVVLFVEMGSFCNAEEVAQQAINQVDLGLLAMDSMTIYSLRSVIGLGSLKDQRFEDAAFEFLLIGEELGDRWSIVMAAHDIAAYGGLCALASFNRTDLKAFVLDNRDFVTYLDTTIEVKELINDFYSRNFSSALEHLANLRKWLLLDIYLFDEFEKLYEIIRNRAIIEYIQPFMSVDLQTMADVFKTDIEDLKKELVALINTNRIKGKIDSMDNVLYVGNNNDEENVSVRSILENCSVIERDLKAILLFTTVLHHQYKCIDRT